MRSSQIQLNWYASVEHQREVLNIVIKYAKDIVKARNNQNKHPIPPYLMMSGGAGAGKSTVIKLVPNGHRRFCSKKVKT